MPARDVQEIQGKSRRKYTRVREKGKASAEKEGDTGETLDVPGGGLSEGGEMKSRLHGPRDSAKTLKLRFRVRDLGLPERRQDIYRVAGRRKQEGWDEGNI